MWVLSVQYHDSCVCPGTPWLLCVSWGTGQCHGCPGMEAGNHLEALSYFMYKMWILELEWALRTFFSLKGKEAKIPRGKWHIQGPRALEQWWLWDGRTRHHWAILEINSLRYGYHTQSLFLLWWMGLGPSPIYPKDRERPSALNWFGDIQNI